MQNGKSKLKFGKCLILELDPNTLPVDSGVENLSKALNNLYLKVRDYSAYEEYKTFEKFKCPPSMTINNYIREFERLYHKKILWHGSPRWCASLQIFK